MAKIPYDESKLEVLETVEIPGTDFEVQRYSYAGKAPRLRIVEYWATREKETRTNVLLRGVEEAQFMKLLEGMQVMADELKRLKEEAEKPQRVIRRKAAGKR